MDYIDQRLMTKSGESLQFQTTINDDVVVPRIQASGMTLFQSDPHHLIVKQYRTLAKEILDRIHRFEASQVPRNLGET
jgi:cellulose biosynthesis protein BcsQ